MPRVPETIEVGESGVLTIVTNPDGSLAEEHEFKWIRSGLRGTEQAKLAAAELAPLYNATGYRRSRVDARPIGNTWYELTAVYSNSSIDGSSFPDAVTNSDISIGGFRAGSIDMDIAGGHEHITQATADEETTKGRKALQNWYKRTLDEAGNLLEPEDRPPDPPPDWGAIGVSGNQVQGCEKYVPSMSWTETWNIPSRILLEAPPPRDGLPRHPTERDLFEGKSYIDLVRSMVGKVNRDDPIDTRSHAPKKWRNFNAGEVLFMGARFSINAGASTASVALAFSQRDNMSNFYVGGVQVANKAGWDHLWVEYETLAQNGGGGVWQRPRYVWVAQIYERRDFCDLLIGSDWPQLFLTAEPFKDPAL
jgi:hypothetical protein